MKTSAFFVKTGWLVLIALLGIGKVAHAQENMAVQKVDLVKILDTHWYVVGYIPIPLFLNHDSCEKVTVRYTKSSTEGKLITTCQEQDGQSSESSNKIRVTPQSLVTLENAKEVAGDVLQIKPSVFIGWKDHWVLDIGAPGAEYHTVVLGGSLKKAVFVFSQSPSLDASEQNRIKNVLTGKGYASDKIDKIKWIANRP